MNNICGWCLYNAKKNLKVIKKSVLNNNTVIPFEILRKEDDIIGLSTYSIAISTGLVINWTNVRLDYLFLFL